MRFHLGSMATLKILSNLSRNLEVWFILDGSDPKKSKNEMAIFILFENVATFYTNIFWYVQPLRTCFLQKDTQTLTLESRINEQVVYWKMEKNPTYTHLFGTIRLLIFSKKSHLYVYSHLYFYWFMYFHCTILLLFY